MRWGESNVKGWKVTVFHLCNGEIPENAAFY